MPKVAQHGVYQDGGIRTVKTSLFWLWAFSVLEMNPNPPAAGIP
jgi:hypothetical protein